MLKIPIPEYQRQQVASGNARPAFAREVGQGGVMDAAQSLTRAATERERIAEGNGERHAVSHPLPKLLRRFGFVVHAAQALHAAHSIAASHAVVAAFVLASRRKRGRERGRHDQASGDGSVDCDYCGGSIPQDASRCPACGFKKGTT